MKRYLLYVPSGDTRKMAARPRRGPADGKFYHYGRCWFAARYFQRFGRYVDQERQFRAEFHRYDKQFHFGLFKFIIRKRIK